MDFQSLFKLSKHYTLPIILYWQQVMHWLCQKETATGKPHYMLFNKFETYVINTFVFLLLFLVCSFTSCTLLLPILSYFVWY